MSSPGSRAVGAALLIVAATMFGISGVVVKSSLRLALSVEGLLVLRLAGSAGVMALVAAVLRPRDFLLDRRDALTALAAGTSMCLLQYFYYLTIRATNVGTAVFLEYLAPTMLVAWGWTTGAMARERWSAAAVVVALAGSWMLVATGGEGMQLAPRAVATGLACAGCLALQTIFLEMLLARRTKVTVFFWAIGVAAAVSLVPGDATVLWRTEWTDDTTRLILYIVLGATVIPLFFLLAAIPRLGAARAGVISTMEPVVAAIGADLVLQERLAPLQWAGGALIVLAVGLIQRAPHATVAEAQPA